MNDIAKDFLFGLVGLLGATLSILLLILLIVFALHNACEPLENGAGAHAAASEQESSNGH